MYFMVSGFPDCNSSGKIVKFHHFVRHCNSHILKYNLLSLGVPGSCTFNAPSICFLGQTHENLKGNYLSQIVVAMEIKALSTWCYQAV